MPPGASTDQPNPCSVLSLQQSDVLDPNFRARPVFRLGDLLTCSLASASTVPYTSEVWCCYPWEQWDVVPLECPWSWVRGSAAPCSCQEVALGLARLPAGSAHAWLDLSSTGTSRAGQSSSLLPAVRSIPVPVVLQENLLSHWEGFEQGCAPL